MKKLFVLLVIAGAVYGFFWLIYPSASLRYEITVEVEVDGEVYAGSNVHEVTLGRQPTLADASPAYSRFKGEAVAIDIADRGTLFMLLTGLRGPSSRNEPFSSEHGYSADPEQLLNVVFDVRPSSAEAVRSLPSRIIDGDVPFNRLPMMVRFEDITDPTTVALVNPFDLAASFGEGVELRRVHVQTTRARVTVGIDDRLPWLGSIRASLDGSTLYHGRTLANSVGVLNFRRDF
ncbi:MAG: hypothetical protein AAGH60_03440 [Pseudomonadota bacterium]